MFERARSAKNAITCMDDIIGFDLITDNERLNILRLMDVANAKRKESLITRCKKPQKQKKQILPSSKTRTSRLTQSGLPSVNILFTNADNLNQGKMSE